MAKDKERSINPAQQQRKLEKAKALKKGKAEQQARRNERLARRNPERLQSQVDDLKALEASGQIKPREKTILEELERDLKAVRKAREALGDKVPQYATRPPRREGDNNILGKRRHDGERKPYTNRRESSGSDTDDSITRIPMPEDTPPPIPREFRRNNRNTAVDEPSGNPRHNHPAQPTVPAKTTYESAPQLRDLKKEAVSRFVPNVVRKKQDAVKGTAGQLLEPEEMDRLEAEGYVKGSSGADKPKPAEVHAKAGLEARGSVKDKNVDHADAEARRLADEEARFMREVAMADQPETENENEDDGVEEQGSGHGHGHGHGQQTGPLKRHVEIEQVDDEDL